MGRRKEEERVQERVEVFRQCVGVSRQWLELRRLVDDDGRRERERESEESIYIQKKSGGKTALTAEQSICLE